MKPIILHDMPEADYHSQTGEKTPLFSKSYAKIIIQKSAYHAYLEHPLLGNEKKAPTKAMDEGSIMHSILLGEGAEIAVILADSFRTNAAKADQAEAREAGKIPILEKEMTVLDNGIKIIKDQIKQFAPEYFEPHETELSVRWEMDNGVKCQSRFDWIQPESGIIYDLKKTTDKDLQKLDTVILDFGSDIQEKMYMDCAAKTWPDMAGRFKWKFIFFEIKPPYMVSVIETDSSMSWLGESKVKRASDKWKGCLESGIWPGYGRQVVSAPPWAVSREEMEGE